MTIFKTVLIACTFSAFAAHTASAENDVGKEPLGAFLNVEYANTLQGIEAMFAVRACATEDRSATRRPTSDARPSSPPGVEFVHETLVPIADDIVVHVIDRDGHEISRHAGAADVCGYARIAAAFVAQMRDATKGIDK